MKKRILVKDVYERLERIEDDFNFVASDISIHNFNKIKKDTYLEVAIQMIRLGNIESKMKDFTHGYFGRNDYFNPKTKAALATKRIDREEKLLRKRFAILSNKYARKEKLKRLMSNEQNN